MSDVPFLGEIKLFGGNFQIQGHVFCNGQLLSINDNNALFALLGTTYGGDGVNTFGVPDLRSRIPIGKGTGGGLSSRTIGEQSGTESVTLLATQIPVHTHAMNCNNATANSSNPSGNFPASQSLLTSYAAAPTAASTMKGNMISSAGGNQPHTNIQPYLAVNYLIATQGIFPSRN